MGIWKYAFVNHGLIEGHSVVIRESCIDFYKIHGYCKKDTVILSRRNCSYQMDASELEARTVRMSFVARWLKDWDVDRVHKRGVGAHSSWWQLRSVPEPIPVRNYLSTYAILSTKSPEFQGRAGPWKVIDHVKCHGLHTGSTPLHWIYVIKVTNLFLLTLLRTLRDYRWCSSWGSWSRIPLGSAKKYVGCQTRIGSDRKNCYRNRSNIRNVSNTERYTFTRNNHLICKYVPGPCWGDSSMARLWYLDFGARGYTAPRHPPRRKRAPLCCTLHCFQPPDNSRRGWLFLDSTSGGCCNCADTSLAMTRSGASRQRTCEYKKWSPVIFFDSMVALN